MAEKNKKHEKAETEKAPPVPTEKGALRFIYQLGGTPTILIRPAVKRMTPDGRRFMEKRAVLVKFHGGSYTARPSNPDYDEIVAGLDSHPAVLRMGQSPEDKAEALANFAPMVETQDGPAGQEEQGGAAPGVAAKGPPRLVAKTTGGKVLHQTDSAALKAQADGEE